MSEEVEAKRGDIKFCQHAGQGPVRRTVFTGEKPVTKDCDAAWAAAGNSQDCRDAMTPPVVENQLFFHGADCSRVRRDAGAIEFQNLQTSSPCSPECGNPRYPSTSARTWLAHGCRFPAATDSSSPS